MSVEERIAGIIIARLELEDLTAATFPKDKPLFVPKPEGFGLDSLAGLEIMTGLSEELGHPFPDVDKRDLATVETLAAYVRRVTGA